jgi:DnaJ family protein C protein 19
MLSQGRAGLVAFRRYKGGTSALGKAFYKGGFESRMNRREAALILHLKYVHHLALWLVWEKLNARSIVREP